MSTTAPAAESELERTVREEDEAHKAGLAGQAGDEGKLFELAPIAIDKTKPTLIAVNVSGKIKLDLSQKSDVEFYNALQAGKLVTYETTFFVASTKKTHRRDNDGNVDATPETKSLVIDGVTFDGELVGKSEPDDD
jgi:hypothetical protein